MVDQTIKNIIAANVSIGIFCFWLALYDRSPKSTACNVYRRYVDDIIMIVKKYEISGLLDSINNFHRYFLNLIYAYNIFILKQY